MGAAAHAKLRLAIGYVKDHASVGKAVLNKKSGLSEIEIAIIRATRHDNSPVDDKYMHEILFLVSNSPDSTLFLAERISQRLNRTRDCHVALKALLLTHRLLRGGNHGFERQLRSAHFSGHLQMSPGRSFTTSFDPLVCFLHKYAAYLNERMGWIINPGGKLEPVMSPGLDFGCYRERSLELVFHRLPKCQLFIDKVLECSPYDDFPSDRLAQAAMCNTLKESFQVYTAFREGVTALVNMFFDLTLPARVIACDILKRASQQSGKLEELYGKCKRTIRIRNLEYPSVEVTTMDHVKALEECLSNIPTGVCNSLKSTSISKRLLHSGMDKLDEVTVKMEWKEREEARLKKGLSYSSATFVSWTMETKISNVWVVFEDEDSMDSS
ncbi:putative clathrin assembly protein At1g33340 [Rhodamnia argentea]|uniref:Clathrin assembly protein At1g33340 n=1 Tax=Rhodamnia argentea TaxID=178133 RepID=A0A8B8NWW8_9MYRT|nr:putative clathrin assembly protein At1g33340 [Rhodamnia argentea]